VLHNDLYCTVATQAGQSAHFASLLAAAAKAAPALNIKDNELDIGDSSSVSFQQFLLLCGGAN